MPRLAKSKLLVLSHAQYDDFKIVGYAELVAKTIC